MTLQNIINEIDLWEDWLSRYKRFVPLFIEEAKTKTKWEDWDKEVFNEFFERSAGQCVASLKQGCFTSKEKNKIKKNWIDISGLLKKIAESQSEPDWETYKKIKRIIRNHTFSDRRSATMRLIAGLQPKLLCTIINEKDLNTLFHLLQTVKVDNIPELIKGDPYRNSYNIRKFFQEQLPDKDVMDIITYPWQVREYLNDNKEMIKEMNMKIKDIANVLSHKKQIILQGAPGTGKTYIAKDISEFLISEKISDDKRQQAHFLKNSVQYKFVQFHPSYTYEDFVRGVVVDTESGTPNYKTINKSLGEFANEALRNWEDSKKTQEVLSKEQGYEDALASYKDYIADRLVKEGKVSISSTTFFIIAVEETAFRYYSEKRPDIIYSLLFSDIIKVAINFESVKKQSDLEGFGLKMKGKHSYYYHFHFKFSEYISENNINVEQSKPKIEVKKYVLVIDEINRANLPVVLGELIYALEYRGESVSSMYSVEGDSSLILPPNLYVIGTMNTADRSVGEIDYAIRRRFSFINMLPENLEIDGFDEDLFESVSKLFISNYEEYKNDKTVLLIRSEYLSEEFRPEDVWLGHSYFIMQSAEGNNKNMRLNYEIKPILKEYLKDGILKISAEKIINALGE